MITKEFDTIAAISTPLGEGAIGIVRLSGSEAIAIADKVFTGKSLANCHSHTLNYGHNFHARRCRRDQHPRWHCRYERNPPTLAPQWR